MDKYRDEFKSKYQIIYDLNFQVENNKNEINDFL
jgi:hypothetical protein